MGFLIKNVEQTMVDFVFQVQKSGTFHPTNVESTSGFSWCFTILTGYPPFYCFIELNKPFHICDFGISFSFSITSLTGSFLHIKILVVLNL